MSNVISFPIETPAPLQPKPASGARTLFLHVKNTTMIVHLGAPHKAVGSDERIGKST